MKGDRKFRKSPKADSTFHVETVQDFSAIDWPAVCKVIAGSGLGQRDPEQYARACKQSFAFVVARTADGALIGTGRLISDGVLYSTIADVTVSPEHRHKGVGTAIMRKLHEFLPSNMCLLFTDPDTTTFYQKLGYHKCSAAMLRPFKPDNLAGNKYLEPLT